MLAGRTTGATSVVGASDMATKSQLAADNIPDDRRRRVSVLKSTRNLMASLRIERKKSKSAEADPIEHFLRKVDTSSMTLKNADGLELDDEEGYVPHALQCQLKGKTCIFLPSAPGRLLWDVMIAIMILYYLFMVPLRIAFDIHNPDNHALTGQGGWLALDIIFDVLFLVDIFINFRTAYNDSGELETSGTKVCTNYLKGWFLMDMVASIPTTIITNMAGVDSSTTSGGFDPKLNTIFRAFKWFKLIKLIRVLRLSRVFDRLEHVTMFWNAGTLRMIRSVAILFVLWHVVACMYWLVATGQGFCQWHISINNTALYPSYNEWDYVSGLEPNGFQDCYDDWVPWLQIQSEPFSTQYAQAFFWAVMVTTGVGKDINPQSQVETAFTIAVIAVGIIAYALVIGSLSSAIQSMDHKSNAHNIHMERINNFMTFNKVPHYMQIAIKQYYEYKWSRPDTDLPVSDLPSILKIRLKVLLNREALNSVPVFRELPADCVIALTQHIKSQTVFPTEFSIHQGQKNTNIYIIRHGRMKLTRHPRALDHASTAKDKWKALLHRWVQNNKAKRASLANLAVTAYRDAYLMSVGKHQNEEFVMELNRGNFYGVNCLLPYQAPEDFSCAAITFSDVLTLDTSSRAMKMIIDEYPIMQEKLTAFAKKRRKRIMKELASKNQNAPSEPRKMKIKKTQSMFGGSISSEASAERAQRIKSLNSFTFADSGPDSPLPEGVSRYAVTPEQGNTSGGETIGKKNNDGDGESSAGVEEGGEAGDDATIKDTGEESGGTKRTMPRNRRHSLGGQQAVMELTTGGTAKSNAGMGALLRQFAKAAVDQERSKQSDTAGGMSRRPSMARIKEAASTDDIRRMEELISDMQQMQLAQFEAISSKMEEILMHMYV